MLLYICLYRGVTGPGNFKLCGAGNTCDWCMIRGWFRESLICFCFEFYWWSTHFRYCSSQVKILIKIKIWLLVQLKCVYRKENMINISVFGVFTQYYSLKNLNIGNICYFKWTTFTVLRLWNLASCVTQFWYWYESNLLSFGYETNFQNYHFIPSLSLLLLA